MLCKQKMFCYVFFPSVGKNLPVILDVLAIYTIAGLIT
jgi:hypothetical protein